MAASSGWLRDVVVLKRRIWTCSVDRRPDFRWHLDNEVGSMPMAQLIVRTLDDAILAALKARAARNERSAEAEHRRMLEAARGGGLVLAEPEAAFPQVPGRDRGPGAQGWGPGNQEVPAMAILEGKVAIVTGASSGIGAATARLFAREGARVVVTARRAEALEALVAAIGQEGGTAAAVAGDVRDEALARSVVETAVGRFGGLDIAFNNAGSVGESAPVEAASLDAWRETLEVNLTGAFLGAKHQVPAMLARGGGSIVFTSSFVGHTAGMPGMAAYAASKAGLIGLMQVLAVELGSKGIRVNAILPGGTDTPASVTNAPGAAPELLDFVEGLHALKRLARPEEIAQSVLHLASDGASFVTGAAFAVDGGVSISRT
jgi:NAD(P)-dependent dehydrogenase (short-subunit alcohol dehydrogenase family)